MGPENQRLSPDERSNLVAYLDGELPAPLAEAIATKLAQSPTARRELESLRKTWELLDLLPLPPAPDDFTARTLVLAESLDGRGDRLAASASVVARKVAVAAGWAAAAAVLFGVGYLVTTRFWPNPSARLAHDLPIAESLDAYREVGTLDFLNRLDEAPEFNFN